MKARTISNSVEKPGKHNDKEVLQNKRNISKPNQTAKVIIQQKNSIKQEVESANQRNNTKQIIQVVNKNESVLHAPRNSSRQGIVRNKISKEIAHQNPLILHAKIEVVNQNVFKINEKNINNSKIKVINKQPPKQNIAENDQKYVIQQPKYIVEKNNKSYVDKQPKREANTSGDVKSIETFVTQSKEAVDNNNNNTKQSITKGKSETTKNQIKNKTCNKENVNEIRKSINNVIAVKHNKMVIRRKAQPTKQAANIFQVLTDLRNSISLMKSSENKDSYSNVVPQLEAMYKKHKSVFHHKIANKVSKVTSQQNTPTKLFSGTEKKDSISKKISEMAEKNMLRIREASNPLEIIKDEVEQAINKRQTFSIRGTCGQVRRALLLRGWIEKYLYRTNDSVIRKHLGYTITELVDLLKHNENPYVCIKVIKSKMLARHQVDLFWDHSYEAFRECSDTVKLTLINRFRRDVFSYTSKEGLCLAAKDSYWFQVPGVSKINHPRFRRDVFSYTSKEDLCLAAKDSYWFQVPGVSKINHPRSYTLTKTGDTKEFIKDFNLTAAVSLLRWIVKNHVTKECMILSETGKVPLKVFAFAVTECYKFIKEINHDDIDNEIEDALDYDWHEFLAYFYKMVHVGRSFKTEEGASELDMVRKSKYILNILKKKCPYLEMDGMMNIWILKPTNSCRGIGIHICRTLEHVLNIVKKNPTRRYVIQKYIEKPFLIHGTKFDIRQWFLISSSNPLTIWMYRQCYLRFSCETYNLRKLHESIHLTNNSVQCKYRRDVKTTINLPTYNMWDSDQFKCHLSDRGYPNVFQDIIYPGMRESITTAVLMHQDKIDKRANCFELYGADFILTEDFKPWLLEINSNPALHNSTPVTQRMCPQVLEDVIKVVVDFDRNPKADTGNFEMIYKQQGILQPTVKGILKLSGLPLSEDHFHNPLLQKSSMKSNRNNALVPKERNGTTNMWMAYSCENWPTAEDLESSIKRMQAELNDLEFDRSHASNYDLNICYDSEAVQRVLEEAERFDNGSHLCDMYLSGRLDLDNFCGEFINIGLRHFLSNVVEFLPNTLLEKYQLESHERISESVESTEETSEETERESIET